MKTIKKMLLLILSISFCVTVFSACDTSIEDNKDSAIEVQQLSMPAGIKVNESEKILLWTEVTNASGYSVQVNDAEPIPLSGNSTVTYSLAPFTVGTYTIKVMAVGDAVKCFNSEWSAPVSYSVEEPSNKLKVTFNSLGGSSVASIFVDKGDKVSKPDDPTKTGFKFDTWYAEDTFKTIWVFLGYSVTENITLYAQWTANIYTISFNTNGGSNAPLSVDATYSYSMPSIKIKPIRTGYDFVGFFDSPTAGTKYYDADLSSAKAWDKTSDAALYAQWTAKTYTLYFDANGGSNAPSSATVVYFEYAGHYGKADKRN